MVGTTFRGKDWYGKECAFAMLHTGVMNSSENVILGPFSNLIDAENALQEYADKNGIAFKWDDE